MSLEIQTRSEIRGVNFYNPATTNEQIILIKKLSAISPKDVWKISFALNGKDYRVVRDGVSWNVTDMAKFVSDLSKWNEAKILNQGVDNGPEPSIEVVCTLDELLEKILIIG